MNAQEMLINYANENLQYTHGQKWTPQEWLGKAITEGIRIYRNHQSVVVNIKRQGNTITVTETTKHNEIKDRQFVEIVDVAEVLTVNL